MEELIGRLDAWLQARAPDRYASLLPGATPEELKALEDTLGISLPLEFRQLYQWKNGQSGDFFSGLTPLGGYSWMSISEILRKWTSMNEFAERFAQEPLDEDIAILGGIENY